MVICQFYHPCIIKYYLVFVVKSIMYLSSNEVLILIIFYSNTIFTSEVDPVILNLSFYPTPFFLCTHVKLCVCLFLVYIRSPDVGGDCDLCIHCTFTYTASPILLC